MSVTSDYSLVKESVEKKISLLQTEISEYVKTAVNYDDLFDDYDDVDDMIDELEWNDAKDERHFNNLQENMWILQKLKHTLDEVMSVNDDNKKAHRLKKNTEMLISSVRKIKKESMEALESEQRVIDEASFTIEVLNGIRENKG